jgi:hypothetical protein
MAAAAVSMVEPNQVAVLSSSWKMREGMSSYNPCQRPELSKYRSGLEHA